MLAWLRIFNTYIMLCFAQEKDNFGKETKICFTALNVFVKVDAEKSAITQ